MLASEKIALAFTAIVEEAEKLMESKPDEGQLARLKSIISIARHQSDIRGLTSGDCSGHHKCK